MYSIAQSVIINMDNETFPPDRECRVFNINYDDHLADDVKNDIDRYDGEEDHALTDWIENVNNDLTFPCKCGDIIDGCNIGHQGFLFVGPDGSLIDSDSKHVETMNEYGVGIPFAVTDSFNGNAMNHFTSKYFEDGDIISVQFPYDDSEVQKYVLPAEPEMYTYEMCFDPDNYEWTMYAVDDDDEMISLEIKSGEIPHVLFQNDM